MKAPFEWEFPDGAKLAYSAVVSVTAVGGGDSTNVAGLEMEIMSNGKPTYTAAVGGIAFIQPRETGGIVI